jgi:hypothetical protein
LKFEKVIVMSQVAQFIRDHQLDAMRIGGQKVGAGRDRAIEVFNPYSAERIGTVPKATLEEVRQAYAWPMPTNRN